MQEGQGTSCTLSDVWFLITAELENSERSKEERLMSKG